MKNHEVLKDKIIQSNTEITNQSEVKGFCPQCTGIFETFEDQFETIRKLNNLRQEFYKTLLCNDYTIMQIVSLFKSHNFNMLRLSSYYNCNSRNDRNSTKKNLFIQTILSVSELMNENGKDFRKVMSLPSSSQEKVRLQQAISKRTKEAAALLFNLNFRETFMLGELSDQLNKIAESFKDIENNESDGKNLDLQYISSLHLDKNSFINYFNKLSTIRDEYLYIRNGLFNQNIGLIYKYSSKFRKKLSEEDAFQEACYGFFRALEKFDLSSGVHFSTFVVNYIGYFIHKAETQKKTTPLHIYKEILKIETASKYYVRKYGRVPDSNELAQYLKMPLRRLRFFLNCNRDLDTASENVSSGRVTDGAIRHYQPSNYDIIYSEKMSKLNYFLEELFKHLPAEILKRFPNCSEEYKNFLLSKLSRNIEIFRCYYGLDGTGHKTYVEVGRRYGIVKARVEQICKSIRRYLRDISAEYNLDEEINFYLDNK